MNTIIELCIFKLGWVPNLSLNWHMLGLNLSKKGIAVLKEKKKTLPLICSY